MSHFKLLGVYTDSTLTGAYILITLPKRQHGTSKNTQNVWLNTVTFTSLSRGGNKPNTPILFITVGS